MKVALYQEGETWENPNIIRICVSMEAALSALPDGFEIQELISHHVTAINKSRERWATIRMYEVEGTATSKTNEYDLLRDIRETARKYRDALQNI